MDPKKWFGRALIYHVLVDRFYGFASVENVPGFAGGTLAGVTRKLDYLKNLGINVIWLSPFYETASYHGYHITSYEKVDPRFGDQRELLNLIRLAKSMGIRVIADFVPNHCSAQHPFFRHATRHSKSPYRSWFIFERWPDQYMCFLNYRELPKLNLENPDVRAYMIRVAKKWLSLGLSGYRLDHVIGPSHSFWKEFSLGIRQEHPGAVLIGEVWAQGLENRFFRTTGIRKKFLRRLTGISQESIQLEYSKELDGVLDFVLQDWIRDSVVNGSDPMKDTRLKKKIEHHMKKAPPGYRMVTFLDNHDMNRFIRYCGGNVKTLLRSFELLLSSDNPVVMYNGTENCRSNEREVSSANANSDLQVRNPVDWDHIDREFVEGFRSLVTKYRKR
jgi:glycosidase